MSAAPIILGLDASAGACSVALTLADGVYGYHEDQSRGHAGRLLTLIDRLLAEAGIGRSSIDAIAVGCGPGGFTGVRISTGVAQGLALGLDRPGIPLSTLKILACMGADAGKSFPVLSVLDARMGEVYVGAFEVSLLSSLVVTPLTVEALLTPDQLVAPAGSWVGLGSGFAAYPALNALAPRAKRILPDIHPDIRLAMPLAVEQFRLAQSVMPAAIQPVYLRNQVAHQAKL
ncbi:MAG: tRNA (adenosine(37)-N6)-threonylcarbamoyltransferase complex dimerization subunit type 1 TsaB [Spiribacter sp.]|jgi:tRNA threonylcarbamoyladenosine biosynthesis protein TsaB|nr:tRNA (adenosine(37)-N6)-threonylcarbamoyltransferase complex dimerization subunit type 1 TsaB [Spiribacter sp.]MDR9488946.1 tRNA (adenosine(37)-N6)-threonylcarbamoyltransferase complex dimerization subunit type 1 TsaB [Spiribacter sp.]